MLKLYVKENCPECDLMGQYLLDRNVDFEVIDIGKNTKILADFGYTRVPVLFRDWTLTHGTYFGQIETTCGFNKEAIDKMIKDYLV